jgi:hypothetical protein
MKKIDEKKSWLDYLPSFMICMAILSIPQLYYMSPFSILYYGHTLEFIRHFFYFPFFVMNEGTFFSCGGFLCIPNPFTLVPFWLFTVGFWLIVWNVLMKIFSIILRFLPFTQKLTKHILFIAMVVTVIIIGGHTEKQKCINEFKNADIKGDKYVSETGIIAFQIDYITQKQFDLFLRVNNLDHVYGRMDGKVFTKVPVGTEFEKLCKIKTYPQVYEGSKPPTVKELTNQAFGPNEAYWLFMDSNFCSTNQINKEVCLQKIAYKVPNAPGLIVK